MKQLVSRLMAVPSPVPSVCRGVFLVTLLAVASAGILGGCVGEPEDEAEAPVGQVGSADTYVPALPGQPGGKKETAPAPAPEVPATLLPGEEDTGGTQGPDPGAPRGSDPQPIPWKPDAPRAR
jgi:hypothetical protein